MANINSRVTTIIKKRYGSIAKARKKLGIKSAAGIRAYVAKNFINNKAADKFAKKQISKANTKAKQAVQQAKKQSTKNVVQGKLGEKATKTLTGKTKAEIKKIVTDANKKKPKPKAKPTSPSQPSTGGGSKSFVELAAQSAGGGMTTTSGEQVTVLQGTPTTAPAVQRAKQKLAQKSSSSMKIVKPAKKKTNLDKAVSRATDLAKKAEKSIKTKLSQTKNKVLQAEKKLNRFVDEAEQRSSTGRQTATKNELTAFAGGIAQSGLGTVTAGLQPKKTFQGIKQAVKDPMAVAAAVGKDLQQNPRGAAGRIVGEVILGKGATTIAQKASVAAKNVVVKTGSTFVPAEKVFDAKALSGKQKFPTTTSTKQSLKEFKQAKGVVQTSSPKNIRGKEVGVGGGASQAGIQDPGLFVTPAGRGSPAFLRIQKPTSEGLSSFDPTGPISINPFKTGSPTVTRIKTSGVEKLPRKVVAQPGFSSVKKFQEKASKSGKAFITKRSELGQGELKPQKFKDNTGIRRTEKGTTEIEAVIPSGTKFERTTNTLVGRFKGFDEFTTIKGRNVPIRKAKTVTSTSSGKGKIIKKSRIISESSDLSSIGKTRRVSSAPTSFASSASSSAVSAPKNVFPSVVSSPKNGGGNTQSLVVPSSSVPKKVSSSRSTSSDLIISQPKIRDSSLRSVKSSPSSSSGTRVSNPSSSPKTPSSNPSSNPKSSIPSIIVTPSKPRGSSPTPSKPSKSLFPSRPSKPRSPSSSNPSSSFGSSTSLLTSRKINPTSKTGKSKNPGPRRSSKLFEEELVLRKKPEEAFAVRVKRKGKFVTLASGFSRQAALDLGARRVVQGLEATFKVVKVGGRAKVTRGTGDFQRFRKQFRDFKIQKGKKVQLQDTFIQKRGKRLGSRSERKNIQSAKRAKMRFF